MGTEIGRFAGYGFRDTVTAGDGSRANRASSKATKLFLRK